MENVLIHKNELKEDLFKKDVSSLREIVTITNINNLVLPRISYKVEGVEYKNEVEQELKTKGDRIHFTKNKFKVSVSIPNIVKEADNEWVITYLKDELKQALEHKEEYCIFKNTNSGEEHMNIYSSQNAIKEIEGEDLFKAIKLALADLNDVYYKNATIVMHRAHYLKIIEELSNYNINFYNKQLEQIIGAKVVFCVFAEKPVVGDFSQLHINYEDDFLFENKCGLTDNFDNIIISGNFDIRVRLSSAFRIAKVNKGY
ncbi:MAG TPA: phage major capsid protein [Candidatus Dwaynia gallinarum]|nr:phage major capsid protein [Candidatus Dwaynia gallinarum]